MPQIYRVTTENGVYNITVGDDPSAAGNIAPARTDTGLMLSGAAAAVPLAAKGAIELATSPGFPKATATLGQIVGGVEGALKGGPMGAAGGVWTGGKAGWFTGKLAQRLAAPVAGALEKVAPYAQTLSTLGAAQGVNDLAQMAEPQRRDIGVLGVGPSISEADVTARIKSSAPTTEEVSQVQKLIDGGLRDNRLTGQGISTEMSKLAKGDPRKYSALMTVAYQRLNGRN